MKNTNRRDSTRRFFAEANEMEHFTLFDRIHGYVYAAFPFFYISVGTGRHWLVKPLRPLLNLCARFFPRQHDTRIHSLTRKSGTIADTYHGKVLPLDSAKTLVQVKEDVRVDDLEQVIPYVDARALILKHPDHLVALDCPCRAAQENPCLPLDVCLVVGEPFATFIREHHPEKSRWITAEQAVKILEEEDQRGHVHHAFFKDAMLGRFYAICNCCACCCGAMRAHRNDIPMLASSGFLAAVNADQCEGCKTCVSYCQFGAISVANGVSHIDEAACMGCGVCVSKCPSGAIALRLAPEKGLPFELAELMKQAAVS